MSDQEDPRLAPAKAFIAKQVDMIKAGDVEGLKAGVTSRVRDRVTAEGLKNAVRSLGVMTIDDLVASIEVMGAGLKIKMKNGRTLTTLVNEDGATKADTVWFK